VVSATGPSLFRTTDISATVPQEAKFAIMEPTVATNGKVVFMTGNKFAAVSTDSGNSFRYINPVTAFPAIAGGMCCDQSVVYLPKDDLWVWSLLYDAGTVTTTTGLAATNVVRLAVARTQDVIQNKWMAYDFIDEDGFQFDFPGLCSSDHYVWMTVNNLHLVRDPILPENSFVYKIAIDQLLKKPAVIPWERFDTAAQHLANFSPRCVQGAHDEMFWGTQNSQSQVRVFSWKESENNVTWHDVTLPFTWNIGDRACKDPTGHNACGKVTDGRILAAWLTHDQIGLLWNAAQGGQYPYPYVEGVRIRVSDFSYVDRPRIYNSAFAWQYPSVGVNARGDLGILAYASGGSLKPTAGLAVVDDLSGDPVSDGWSFTLAASSTHGPADDVWGDFGAVAGFQPGNLAWVSAIYSLQGCELGACVAPAYVVFGRERDKPSPCYLGRPCNHFVDLPVVASP